MEYFSIRRCDQAGAHFKDRVRQSNKLKIKWAQGERALHRDHVQFYYVGNAFFFQLAANKRCREWCRVKRYTKVDGKICHCADMVFMTMGQHDTEQVFFTLLDKFEIGQNKVNARIFRVRECQAKINHYPLAFASVQIDVHANFIGPAKGKEKKFIFWGRH